MGKRKFTDEQEQEICRRYSAGRSMEADFPAEGGAG